MFFVVAASEIGLQSASSSSSEPGGELAATKSGHNGTYFASQGRAARVSWLVHALVHLLGPGQEPQDHWGTVPHTVKGNGWENETNRKLDEWPREAAGSVVMNPVSRQNYHKAWLRVIYCGMHARHWVKTLK